MPHKLSHLSLSLHLFYAEAKFTHSEVHWYWVCSSVSLTIAFTCVANTDSGIDNFHHPSVSSCPLSVSAHPHSPLLFWCLSSKISVACSWPTAKWNHTLDCCGWNLSPSTLFWRLFQDVLCTCTQASSGQMFRDETAVGGWGVCSSSTLPDDAKLFFEEIMPLSTPIRSL